MKTLTKWLQRLRYAFHRHRWVEIGRFIKRTSNGTVNIYFLTYRCTGCPCQYEHVTKLGQLWAELHGRSREGLSYIPNMGFWRHDANPDI